MTANIIPFLPARCAAISQRATLASGAVARPAAIPYSSLGNPSSRFDRLFDPIAFNAALYEHEIDAVREALSK